MDGPFGYMPLDVPDGIRLLQLLPPTNGSDIISCSVLNTRLEERPSYEALSYCWGASDSPSIIRCNGQDLSVTANLHQALRSLQRLEDSTVRRFWIDAICINQKDGTDLASHMVRMRQIYNNAINVLVWVGDAVERFAGRTVKVSVCDSGFDYNDNSGLKSQGYLPGSVLKYLEAPVFTRAWAFQELVCSRRASVLLDEGEVDWETFWGRAATETISYIILSGHHPLPSASMPAFRFFTAASSVKIFASSDRLLAGIPSSGSDYNKGGTSATAAAEGGASQWAMFLDFIATLHTSDPKDRIFQLIGLADVVGIHIPSPEHSKPTRVLFQETLSALKTRASKAKLKKLHNWLPHRPFTAPSHASHPTSKDAALLGRDMCPDQCAAHDWHCQPENSSDPGTSGMSSGAYFERDHHSFFDHILRHHKGLLLGDVLRRLTTEAPYCPVTCLGVESQQALGSQLGAVPVCTAALNARNVAKRKRQSGSRKQGGVGGEDEEEEDGDDDGRQRKKQAVDPWSRLACPYFQRDLDCPRLNTSCRGPGFETTSRLKEHLYRVHHIHPCLRCGQVFESREALGQHLQLIQPCNPVQWRATFSPSQGFDDPQKERLGKKTVRTWQQIFGILFPRDDPASYPPQHYSNTGFVQLLDRFHQHYLVESQRLLPQRLVDDASSNFHDLFQGQEERLEAYALRLVNEIFEQIIGSFRRELIRGPTAAAAPHATTVAAAAGEAEHTRPARALAAPLLGPPQQAGIPVPQTTGDHHQPSPSPYVYDGEDAATVDPLEAFEEYLHRFAPPGTFDLDLPPPSESDPRIGGIVDDHQQGAADKGQREEGYEWVHEDAGLRSD